jgi:hypothetical protein
MNRCLPLVVAALLSLGALPAQAAPIVSGEIVDGDTFLSANVFRFTNDSTAGEQILSLSLTIPAQFFFDVNAAAPGIAPSGPTINNNPGGAVISVADGTNSLSVTFTDFDPAELFAFGLDIDAVATPDNTVNGADLVGTSVFVTFTGGITRQYTFVNDGIAGNGIAAVLADVPEPASMLAFGIVGAAGAVYGCRRRKHAKA